MKKFTITVISLFMVLLISLSAVGEAMGRARNMRPIRTTYKVKTLLLKIKAIK